MENLEETEYGENGTTGQEDEIQTLIVTEDMRSYLYDIARWGRIIAIIGFVFSGLMVLASFSSQALIDSTSQTVGEKGNPYAALGVTGMMIVILLVAMLYFYPSLMLFKFSNLAKKAVLYGDQESLDAGLSALKSFFKFIGIVTIIVVFFYGLVAFSAVISKSMGITG